MTIFLIKTAGRLAGQKITLTVEVENVDRTHHELAMLGVSFVSPPKRQMWGHGAEVLHPDGCISHMWDEVTTAKAMRELKE